MKKDEKVKAEKVEKPAAGQKGRRYGRYYGRYYGSEEEEIIKKDEEEEIIKKDGSLERNIANLSPKRV